MTEPGSTQKGTTAPRAKGLNGGKTVRRDCHWNRDEREQMGSRMDKVFGSVGDPLTQSLDCALR